MANALPSTADNPAALAEPCSAWPLTRFIPELRNGSAHVWSLNLDALVAQSNALSSVLSDNERVRAARFRFPLHRDRFIAGRSALRQLLSTYLSQPPAELRFTDGVRGKPFLAPCPERPRSLAFNVTHSGPLALVAIGDVETLGVDVEALRRPPEMEALVRRVFCPNEAAVFETLPDELRTAAFFNLWTRKEAWLKATGEGIAHLLNRVEVEFLPGKPARFVALPETESPPDWCLLELQPCPGFIGAVCGRNDLRDVRPFQMPPDLTFSKQ